MIDVPSLIKLILWYKNKYHPTDFIHDDLIKELKEMKGKHLTAEDRTRVDQIESQVDGWLDTELGIPPTVETED